VKVTLVGASTLCGRISPAGLGSLLDRRRLEEARDMTQASIMGANTLRADNPEMRGTNGNLPEERIRAIISRSGSIETEGKKLFQHGPRPVVFTAAENVLLAKKNLRGMARVIPLPETEHGLSVHAALEFLTEHGAGSVLIEGGAKLNYTALAEGVVDDILLTILPYISGDSNSPTFAQGPNQLGEPFMEFSLEACETVSTGEVFLHYRKL
jgi:riboflavin biosynthesis pyrimidine reductase